MGAGFRIDWRYSRETPCDLPMSQNFRDYDQAQLLLMPPSVQEWVKEDSLARFISDVVGHEYGHSTRRTGWMAGVRRRFTR